MRWWLLAGVWGLYASFGLVASCLAPLVVQVEEELGISHAAMGSVLANAFATLQQRTGNAIDIEIRDFLAVHGKPGQPCPRCGSNISQVQRRGIATHFCRTCQPGLMLER